MPIFLILILTSIVAALVIKVPLNAVPQMLFGSLDKFSLLAVPLFIFAGAIFSLGGISDRLIRWVQAIFGGTRGSLALTTVGTYEFFGAISGSSVATVAAIGKSLYPALRKSGYDERFSLGLSFGWRNREHHPALDHHDHLWRGRRAISGEAVHGGISARHPRRHSYGSLHLVVRQYPRARPYGLI